MSYTYGFYNSSGGDRTYDATDFSRIFDGVINDGVYASVLDKLMVEYANDSSHPMDVNVKPGRSWHKGTWTYVESSERIEIRESRSTARIDAIVIEKNTASRTNTLTRLAGPAPSGGSNPVPPTLHNGEAGSENLFDQVLAYIYVPADATTISQANITNAIGFDTVNITNLVGAVIYQNAPATPFVTSILQQTDISALFAQWTNQFAMWINSVRDIIESIDPGGEVLAELLAIMDKLAGADRLNPLWDALPTVVVSNWEI